MIRKVLFGISILLFSTVAVSDDSRMKGFMDSTVGNILLAEGIFAANSLLAAGNPELYGYLGAALFPLASGASDTSKGTIWAGLLAAETLAIYNITELSKEKYDADEVFLYNMVGWHMFAAVVGIAGYINDDWSRTLKQTPEKNFGLSVLPDSIYFGYSFRFGRT